MNGGTESDDSEQWEDFFGSTTDITPALVGIYDSLTEKISDSQSQSSKSLDDQDDSRSLDKSLTLVLVSKKEKSTSSKLPNINEKNGSFNILSPTVQRILSQSCNIRCPDNSQNQHFSFSNSDKSTRKTNIKQKAFHLPLSKNTSKLVYSGNETIEILDTNIESGKDESINKNDFDKTPTNEINGNFSFENPPEDNVQYEQLSSLVPTETNNEISDLYPSKPIRKFEADIEDKKLQHRQMSSCSICSTSSSSSIESIADRKLSTSYLASIESLADQSGNEHESYKNLTVLERSCLEIIDSERSYVEDLRQIIQGYLLDWKERACLKTNEITVLFSNIEEIYAFNVILFQMLINSQMDPIKISECFVKLKEGFNVYTTYCTSYPDAISLLTTLLQASHTNALLTSTQKLLQHTLPLGSYLLKPVQRILKYHLLLDNLRKHCNFEKITEAYEIMRDVARNIDQVKRKLEQQSRVKELSGILDGWLGPKLTVLGELKLEGLLMENNKPRMIFLFETMLIITKPKEDNRLQFKCYINRNNLMLREHLPCEPTSFNVIPYDEPRNQMKLTARNRDQKRLWAQSIKDVILQQFNIPNRAKELVYQLGEEEDRTPDKNIWKWGSNSSTPTYLERRNQYRRSEMRNRTKNKRKNSTNSPVSQERKNTLMRQKSMDDCMISTPIESESEGHREENADKNCSDLSLQKPTQIVEIKLYNTKTIPKRIAKIKKSNVKKETSKFYMDLDETVLKITESSEQLVTENEFNKIDIVENHSDAKEVNIVLPIELKRERDAEIISALIKESKDFDKIFNKNVKKKSLDNRVTTPDLLYSKDVPPHPPTESPPPLDSLDRKDRRIRNINEEPIYETLLRNVHVPYKHTFVLNRSKSEQFRKTSEKSNKTQRPESDYVTLIYSETGELKDVTDLPVNNETNTTIDTQLDKVSEDENKKKEIIENSKDVKDLKISQSSLFHRWISSKSDVNSGIDNPLVPSKKANSSNNLNTKDKRRYGGKDSVYSGHRHFNKAIGERMAHLEYADPKALINFKSNSQRDSVVSLTSSSDSVLLGASKQIDRNAVNNFNYEENIETLLEKDFRDSAVYSDDERKFKNDHIQLQNDKRNYKSTPPIPPKPSLIPKKFIRAKSVDSKLFDQQQTQSRNELDQKEGKSWVLQQIANFNQ